MDHDFVDLSTFDGSTRLFPLPNVVLFPHVIQPLHIFEPRYRHMTADALTGDRFLTMALLQDGWEGDYEGRPALHPVACLGKIIAEQRLPDGRYNLLLRGIRRLRILREAESDTLYRVAHVELLHDHGAPDADRAAGLRQALADRALAWFKALSWDEEQLQKLMDTDLAVGAVGDVLSFTLPLPIPLKQQLLEELDVAERVRALLEHLETNQPQAPEGPRPFPPEFSPN